MKLLFTNKKIVQFLDFIEKIEHAGNQALSYILSFIIS